MDSYLRKMFLANLTIDLNWSDDMHTPASKNIWGPNYWYENERWRYYLANPYVPLNFYPQLAN